MLWVPHITQKKSQNKRYCEITEEINGDVVLIGGPADEEKGKAILGLSGKRIYNLAGKCTLHESAMVISQCACLITPDTGMMHIGAALKVPLAVLWGNTVPDFGMYPYKMGDNYYSSEVKLSCRPCSKIGYEFCPKGHFNCMNLQNIKSIIDWVEKRL